MKHYEVRLINDVEGRTTRREAVFTSEAEALRYARSDQGRDMYGNEGRVNEIDSPAFKTAEEAGARSWKEWDKGRLKRQAMEKLTKEERDALGLF